MAFTVSPSSYQGGAFLFQGLSNLGQGVAGGITGALDRYEKEHNEQVKADELAYNLTQQTGYDGKPILSQSAFERLMSHRAGDRAAQMSGILAALKMGQEAGSQGAENRLKTAQANYYTQRDEPFTPSIENLPNPATGETTPVLRTSPRSVVPVPGAGQPPEGGPTTEGDYYWNGKQWVQRRAVKAAAAGDDYTQAQMAAIDAEIQKHKVAIAQGEQTYHNPKAWFDFYKPRSDRIGELERAKAALAPAGRGADTGAVETPAPTGPAPGAAPAPAAAGGGNIAAANAIKAQFKAGQITREQAIAQLNALGFQ